jgi:selenide, water dikinase
LSDALKVLTSSNDPNLLVSFDTADDAAVYRLTPEIALVSTVDFITPPVDDPYWFGQIAAANSLSDVYAMGGKPLTALNLIMFPSKVLDKKFLKEILRGGHDKVIEAGASMCGGHSVDDNEPKYGLAVTGVVHPEKILKNSGAQEGDALILTKPLGTGVLFNASKSKKLPYRELELILPHVASLNKIALNTALEYDIHACTDVTGFGLAGHTLEIAKGSRKQINLFYKELPFYPNACAMYQKGETTGSNKANRKILDGYMEIEAKISRYEEELLFDPQTSGGLLFSVPGSHAGDLIMKLKKAGVETAVQVGEVVSNAKPCIRIV